MARFKLLRGIYEQREWDPEGGACERCIEGKQVDSKPCTVCKGTGKKTMRVIYNCRDPRMNIVTSDQNLTAKYGYEKFQNLDELVGSSPGEDALRRRIAELEAQLARERGEEVPATNQVETGPDLQGMSIAQLRAYAQKNDIDLEPGLKKDEIISLIQFELESASAT